MAPTRYSSLRNVGSNQLTTYDLLHGLLKESVFAGRNVTPDKTGDGRSKILKEALRSDVCEIAGLKRDKIKSGLNEKERNITNSKEEILADVKSDKAKRLANLIHQLLRYVSITMKKQHFDRQQLDAKVKKEASTIECLYNKNYNNPLPNSQVSAENLKKIKRSVEKRRSKIEVTRKYSDREKGGGCSNAENPDKPVSDQKKRSNPYQKYHVEESEEEIVINPSKKLTTEIPAPYSIGKVSHRYSTKERSHDSHNPRNVHNCTESTNNKLKKVSSTCKKQSGTEFKVWEGRGSDHVSRRANERKEDCAEGLCNCCYRCECPKSYQKEQDGGIKARSLVEELDREERELLEREEKCRKSEKKKSLDKEISSERRSSDKKRRISSEKKPTPERKIPLEKSDRIPYDDGISLERKIPSDKRKSSERRRSQEKRKSPKRNLSTPEKQLSDESTTLKKRSAELDDHQRRRSLDKRSSPKKSTSKDIRISIDENDESRKKRKHNSRSVPEEKRRQNKETSKEKYPKANSRDGYISEDAAENKRPKKEKERLESDLPVRRRTIVDELDEEQLQYSDDFDKNDAGEWGSDRPVKRKEGEHRTRRLPPGDSRPRVYREERDEGQVWRSSRLSTIEEEQKSIPRRKPQSIQPRVHKSRIKTSERNIQGDESCPFITHEKSLISTSYIDICNQYADSVADACVTEYDDAIHQICREFLEQALPGISFDYDSPSEKYYNNMGNLNSLFGRSQWYPISNSAW